jgi:hypothetical protein
MDFGIARLLDASHATATGALHGELSRITDIRARFLREGYVANKIGHAGVVRVVLLTGEEVHRARRRRDRRCDASPRTPRPFRRRQAAPRACTCR